MVNSVSTDAEQSVSAKAANMEELTPNSTSDRLQGMAHQMQCGADLQDFVRGGGALHGALDHDTGGQDFLQQARHYAGPCSMWQVRHTIGSYHQPALAKHSNCASIAWRGEGGEGAKGELHNGKHRRFSRKGRPIVNCHEPSRCKQLQLQAQSSSM